MKIVKMNVMGKEIMFVCQFRNTRNGFAHDAHMFINGLELSDATCHYLNRTWESWNYQSVCLECCSNRIKFLEGRLKDDYKRNRGISRMTAKHTEALSEIIKTDKDIALLKAIKKNLNDNQY